MGLITSVQGSKSILNEVKDLVPRSKDPSKLRTSEAPALNFERRFLRTSKLAPSFSVGRNVNCDVGITIAV